jgi:hypothetical protein
MAKYFCHLFLLQWGFKIEKVKIVNTNKSSFPEVIRGKGQNYENQNVESQKEHRKSIKGSEHQKSTLKWSERWKIRTTTTTYGILPMDTKACGG